jgi:hypothetical protein
MALLTKPLQSASDAHFTNSGRGQDVIFLNATFRMHIGQSSPGSVPDAENALPQVTSLREHLKIQN